jgi:hypothetical protein
LVRPGGSLGDHDLYSDSIRRVHETSSSQNPGRIRATRFGQDCSRATVLSLLPSWFGLLLAFVLLALRKLRGALRLTLGLPLALALSLVECSNA